MDRIAGGRIRFGPDHPGPVYISFNLAVVFLSLAASVVIFQNIQGASNGAMPTTHI